MLLLKIKNILIFLLVLLCIDFILTIFLKKKINYYDIFYPNLNHRISNPYYHHSFAPNVDTYDTWGHFQYKFVTNSLGFKDSLSRKINNNKFFGKRIIIIGDSFTEGIGFEYKDTFVGILDKQLAERNIEILNAGVASQSPIIYYSKIKYLIKKESLKFNELIIFLDISDIPDEMYIEQENNQLIINSDKKRISENIGIFLSKNFSSILLYNLLIERLDRKKRRLEKRFFAAKEFNKSFFKISNEEINLYKAIKVKRGNWTHDDYYWEKHGKKGRDFAQSNLIKLLELCNKNNIKMSLVVYPWPSQIYYDLEAQKHRLFWNDWTKKNNVDFYDLFVDYSHEDKNRVIKKYFISGDIHWNKIGHKFIADILLKKYFKK